MGLGFLALMCGCKIPSIVYQQETSTVGIVETFGQLDRLLLPGINLVNPCT
jgi:regulator of protease activity HflC (stomatin/prohibitin superfamily)